MTDAADPSQTDDIAVTAAICAFRRPGIVDTLRSLADQTLPEGLRLQVVVVENDDAPNLKQLIVREARALGLDLRYRHVPGRNISIARNACLDAARGRALLFIDDDEIAEPDWAARLVTAWRTSGAGVVFGPAYAVYPPNVPLWMRRNDFHSNIPTRNQGIVETGFSSNALLDLTDPRVRDARFDLAFGRTGGEDVDFFFRLHRAGVAMTITDDAIVREPVAADRLSIGWLVRRRRTVGAIYGTCASVGRNSHRIELAVRGGAKAGYCGLRALISVGNRERSIFWLMRGMFHAGVVSGCIAPPRGANYGSAST